MRKLSKINESLLGNIQKKVMTGEQREEDKIRIEFWPENMTDLKKIIFDKVLKDRDFNGYLEMRDVDVSNLNDLGNAFSSLSCSSIIREINVKGWNVSNVVNMTNCFSGCTELVSIEGLDTWDVSKVLSMRSMFFKCRSLEGLDIKNWNVENVRDMGYMFLGCSSLEGLNLEKWNLNDKVIIEHMFKECPIGYEIVDGHFERYRLP